MIKRQFGLLVLVMLILSLSAAVSKANITVQINKQPARCSFGTAAGVWFFYGGRSQALVLGFPDACMTAEVVGAGEPVGTGNTTESKETVERGENKETGKNTGSGATAVPGDVAENVENKESDENKKSGKNKESGKVTGPNYRLHLDLAAGDVFSFTCPEVQQEITFQTRTQSGDYEITQVNDESTNSRVMTVRAKTRTVLELVRFNVSLEPVRPERNYKVTEVFPDLTPVLAEALIEWDWRLQDGIETPRESRTYAQAIEAIVNGPGVHLNLPLFKPLSLDATEEDWEKQWLEIHRCKRAALLSNPQFNTGPLMFVKHVPSVMSHQLTQVYGYAARPGGGLFVLRNPGQSFETRSIASREFPSGNFMKSDISPDGKTLYTAFCPCETAPAQWRDPNKMSQRYQIYSINIEGLFGKTENPDGKTENPDGNIGNPDGNIGNPDGKTENPDGKTGNPDGNIGNPDGNIGNLGGSTVRQLTSGDADSFAPVVSPTGEIIYLSTLRGTYHRCGGGPCYLYTLTLMDASGGNIRPISFHETNEWDPTILDNGRILYTRWDYVDRNAVHYQNLWQTRLDGTDVRIFYGNNTYVPCGIWESRQVPGSGKIMAIGGPHHGLSAGSVILVDPTRGVDGPEPIERLTPDVAYPETEVPLAGGNGYVDFDTPVGPTWYSGLPGHRLPVSESQRRWPGQTFKAPYPLSESLFIASFSYDCIHGELCANTPNQYGLYLADRYGNRELLYRDPNISSLWAIPLSPPQRRIYSGFTPYVVSDAVPPVVSRWKIPQNVTGTMLMQNVYESDPKLENVKITALRIVQVLPKSTPHANTPDLGFANASPGKQVLGTVPVESDGSAYFELPACLPVLFQALDEQGRAVQTMRSLTYVQPGENANCIGCHEDRMKTPANTQMTLASRRGPSKITPGPSGSKPFSYPQLVQPVLDRHCVCCHNPEKLNGIDLTGTPEGRYTRSYNQLRPWVTWSAWGNGNNNFEPVTPLNKVGTFGSRLTPYLESSHKGIDVSAGDKERLYIWMDACNSLFYGTFNFSDQSRQQQGQTIEGPDAE